MKMVQQKTNSDEVIFSTSTMSAEKYAFEKLMGPEKYGRVRGLGTGVYSNDICDQYTSTKCDSCSLVLEKMHVMEKWFENFRSKKEMEAGYVSGNGTETGQIISPTIGDRHGKRKQDDRQDMNINLRDEEEDVTLLSDDDNGLTGFTSSQMKPHAPSDKEKKQDIGYAKLANLPPQYGLYSSFVPPLVYAFMGSSRDIAIGSVAVVSLLLPNLIKAEIDPENDAYNYRRLMFTATFFAGITQATLGFCRGQQVFRRLYFKSLSGYD